MRQRFSKDILASIDAVLLDPSSNHSGDIDVAEVASSSSSSPSSPSLLETLSGYYSAAAKSAEAYELRSLAAGHTAMHEVKEWSAAKFGESSTAFLYVAIFMSVASMLLFFGMICCWNRPPARSKRPTPPPAAGRILSRPPQPPSGAACSSQPLEAVKKSQYKSPDSSDSEDIAEEDTDSDIEAHDKAADLIKKFEDLQQGKKATTR